MNLPRFLYRGDKLGNSTLPEQHFGNGLISKLINSGDPAYITKNGIYKSINAHISPNSEEELKFYRSSHFLSFSDSKEIALYYAADKKTNEMIEVKRFKERRYLFTFDLNQVIYKDYSKNVYMIQYKCNRNLIEPYEEFDMVYQELSKTACDLCAKNELSHSILILDVVSILKSNADYRTFTKSIENAEKDKEWLILPFDYKQELWGYSSKIPRADFWSTQYFKLRSEPERYEDGFDHSMMA